MTGNDRNATIDFFPRCGSHKVLSKGHGRGFTRGARSDDGISAIIEVEVHQTTKRLPVDVAIDFHRRRQGTMLPVIIRIFLTCKKLKSSCHVGAMTHIELRRGVDTLKERDHPCPQTANGTQAIRACTA